MTVTNFHYPKSTFVFKSCQVPSVFLIILYRRKSITVQSQANNVERGRLSVGEIIWVSTQEFVCAEKPPLSTHVNISSGARGIDSGLRLYRHPYFVS